MTNRTAVIVGGGIGGLAAAIALQQRNWQVEVLERAETFGEVGAGLTLWPNALRALDALGLAAQVRAFGAVEAGGGIRTPSGRWLSHTDTEAIGRKYGPIAMVHRADLLDLLVSAVPGASLHGGTEVVDITKDGVVTTSDRTERKADLVVAADGIHSTARTTLWPTAQAPRYAGYRAWRFITPQIPERLTEAGETWGRAQRFGIAPLPDGRVYCFAVVSSPAGSRGGLKELRERFGHWHDPIPALLDLADDESLLEHDIDELPDLPSFATGRVVLLGDAAHAMTPNLGQGACQALEDAVTLAAAMDTTENVTAYDRLRRPRTQLISRRSRKIGAIGQWASPVTTAVRDAALALMPSGMFVHSLGATLDWAPGDIADPKTG